MVVTDNSRTQTGKKWTAMSHQNITKQRTFVPHKQNQNKAERQIQDAKHKTKIEYFEPTAKFPNKRWQVGCFVGITWNASDEFKFKVWTELDGNWKKGSELIRKQVPTKKRHGCDHQVVFKLVDIP
eukprot:5976852-Ditylum_brightwellii.AAC.1